MKALLASAITFCVLGFASPAEARLDRDRVPEPLAPWVDWVLEGHESVLCPLLQDGGGAEERRCLWPGRLTLELGARSGSFSQTWWLHREGWVPLPGDAARWPQDVTVDGVAAAVIPANGAPGLHLGAGRHTIRGAFQWDTLPEALPTPPETGLVSLTLFAQPVPQPLRDERGQLWLQRRVAAEPAEEDRLEIEVHRLLTDDVPLSLSTQVDLRVAGRNREVLLGRALPEGFAPLAIRSPLPTRFEPDGRLRVQLRAGTWTIQLEARHDLPVEAVAPPDPGGPWDDSEVWAFAARPELREVEPEGRPSVDPQQTQLPRGWRGFPAYLMEPGQPLRLVERRRGDSDPAPDQLALERTWWLDFDGGGYSVADRIQGEIRRTSRLTMGEETQLGRVAISGSDVFITHLPDESAAGVEVPRGLLHLEADSRVAGPVGSPPAVGWQHDFQSVFGRLHLPPGWRLFHATGVDQASPTWIDRWTLLDLFIVLLVAMTFFRLWGPLWGATALVSLALTYTEPGAPRWSWVAFLVAEALVRVVPAARFPRLMSGLRGARLAAAIVLVVIALPFALGQVRGALFPALETRGPLAMFPSGESATYDEVDALQDAPAAKAPGRMQRYAEESLGAGIASSVASLEQKKEFRPDPAARITTGPGLPTWEWRNVSLRWNGPVERSQRLGLFLLSPALNFLLALLRVVGLAAILWRALLFFRGGGGTPAHVATPATGAAAALLIAIATTVFGPPARADLPSPELLEELRQRLLEPPECLPECASIPQLALDVSPDALRLRLALHAAADVAIPLPVGNGFAPERVLLNGEPAPGLIRRGGVLWIGVEQGLHEVVIEGPLPARDTLEIPLPLKPRLVTARADGWLVHGLREDGLAEDNLQLARIRERDEERRDALAPGSLPPFVRVDRRLSLGLHWEARTVVQRVTDPGSTVVLEIPLLPGESITSAAVRTDNGRALVTLGPGVRQLDWPSVIEPAQELVLEAPRDVAWAESWRVDVSPVWHFEAEGIPPVHEPQASGRTRLWRPWPGESVRLLVSRPEGVEGATVTIDSSKLSLRPGERATDATLLLSLRSSQGGTHTILLPEGAELQSATIAGSEQRLRQDGRDVTLPLRPGSTQVVLGWREPRGTGFRFVSSEVGLGAPSVNTQVEIAAPEGRWTLFVGGPRLGPAVLFWPFLVVLAVAAIALGRIPLTPLRSWHWGLLGLGLTQAPIWGALFLVGWLLLLGWRRERGTEVPGRWFDGLQVVIAGFTVMALLVLFFSIQKGLLGLPEMQITGNDSYAGLLRWYQDRAGPTLPEAWVVSVPVLVYRAAMLAWALWLATAVIRWLRWGWECFTAGETWRPLRRAKV